MKYRRVQVDWLDSTSWSQPWHMPERFTKEVKDGCGDMTTVGYIFHEDKYHYYMASSLHFNSDGMAEKVGNVFSIPKGCVLKIKRV